METPTEKRGASVAPSAGASNAQASDISALWEVRPSRSFWSTALDDNQAASQFKQLQQKTGFA